jgi:hypothetical protein
LAAIARSPRQFGTVITDLQLAGAGLELLKTARDGAYDYPAKPFALQA